MSLAPSASSTFHRSAPGVASGTWRRLLGIDPGEASFARRGFAAADPLARSRLEHVGRTFIFGYNAGLAAGRADALAAVLDAVPSEDRGFAYEGAAMSSALLDLLTPWRRDRLAALLAGPGERHAYMVHVGAGWALARLRRSPLRTPLPLDPLLASLATDGYGFHEGYFAWRRSFDGQRRPRAVGPEAARAFDQGLGRSLWFVAGADATAIARRIEAFAAARRDDLWSGVGLAAAYAGGVGDHVLNAIRSAAGERIAHVAQGAAFAAQARERALNPAAHTERACRILAGCSAAEAARATDEALDDIRASGTASHQGWRRRIRERLLPRIS